jgi:hypothetical protein
MKYVMIKLFIGLVLFGTLVALTFNNIPNSGRLLDFCYGALMGLGVMHLGSGPQDVVADKQGGFASPFMLLFMAALSLSITACTTVSTQNAKVTYTQSCAAYGGAFDVMIALRKGGKLNQAQIDQVTLIDSQVTPLCTGPLPQDLDAATAQITGAVTALTILEAVK